MPKMATRESSIPTIFQIPLYSFSFVSIKKPEPRGSGPNLKFFSRLGVGVHELLLFQKYFFAFHMVPVGHTTIHRTYRGTLWLVVEAHALGAFVGHYIVDLIAHGFLYLLRVHFLAIGQDHVPLQGSAVTVSPFIGTFINCIIGAFRLAGATIDALIRYNYCHIFSFYLGFIFPASITLGKNKP